MALKPTIYKFTISVSDFNHDYYDTINLTVALHPSETVERMMARVLAYCLHLCDDADKLMTFTKGLSAIDEPDIWLRSLDDQIQLWVDVGEPSFERIKKSCRLAKQTCVYSFNSKSAVWWKQAQPQFETLPVTVVGFDWESIQGVSQLVSRTMDLSISINDTTAFVTSGDQQRNVNWHILQSVDS